MGADMKSLRLRIHSVDSTLHLTKAMGMVASSKIRRASRAMLNGREYKNALQDLMEDLTRAPECQKSPYMRNMENDPKTRIIVIAGDRGLCGGYNANVFRAAREYPNAEIIPIGKRSYERFGGEFHSSETYSTEEGYELAKKLCADFIDEKYDRLMVIHTNYISMMTQEAEVSTVLPLEKTEGKPSSGVLFEPDEAKILSDAVIEYVSGVIMAYVRESFASEVAARRMAMDNAGKNAEEMINDLQLQYNRARQGAITQEITEIVAGSGQ